MIYVGNRSRALSSGNAVSIRNHHVPVGEQWQFGIPRGVHTRQYAGRRVSRVFSRLLITETGRSPIYMYIRVSYMIISCWKTFAMTSACACLKTVYYFRLVQQLTWSSCGHTLVTSETPVSPGHWWTSDIVMILF